MASLAFALRRMWIRRAATSASSSRRTALLVHRGAIADDVVDGGFVK